MNAGIFTYVLLVISLGKGWIATEKSANKKLRAHLCGCFVNRPDRVYVRADLKKTPIGYNIKGKWLTSDPNGYNILV